MDTNGLKEIAFWMALAYSAISTIVLWGFFTGRWSRGMSSDVESLRGDFARISSMVQGKIGALEVTLREQSNHAVSTTERLNHSLGDIVSRLALIERDVLMVQELRSEVSLMKTELLQTASKAKHDAINAIDGTLKMLEVRKVNTDLHEAQVEEIHRRLGALERITERRRET